MRLQPTFTHPLVDLYRLPGGPWDVPSLDVLLQPSRHTGPALVDGTVALDHEAVGEAVGALAGGLRERGVGRGDVVVWQLPNWYEAVLLFRACWQLGAIASPVHHRLGPSDLSPLLDVLEPRVVVAAPELALARHPHAVVARDGSNGFAEMLDSRPAEPVDLDGAELAVAVATSGSTGQPKIVLLSHRALAYKARIQQAVHGLHPDDVVLMPAPFSHVSGLLNGVLLPGASGMKVVLMDVWNPERALELIEAEHVTFMGGPAVFLTALIESPGFDPSRVRSLRVCSMGGSTMTPDALAHLADRLGCVVKRAYGMTEAPTVTTMHAGDPDERGRVTDGRAVGDADVIVVDPANGQRRSAGEVGEIWVRGPEMFSGYAVAGQTADAVAEGGWLRTGDLGVLDPDGWLTIAGRIKELIIRGGENIASAEVEGLLESHPSVRHAVAVGYPDPILGERVAAVVVADTDFNLDECRRWFAERAVAKFKTPEMIVPVAEIPMSATGKPDRVALRRHVAALLAGEATPR